MSALEDIERSYKKHADITERLKNQLERIKKYNPGNGNKFYFFNKGLEKIVEHTITKIFLDESSLQNGLKICYRTNSSDYSIELDRVFLGEGEVKEFKIKRLKGKLDRTQYDIEIIKNEIFSKQCLLEDLLDTKRNLEKEINLLENGEKND